MAHLKKKIKEIIRSVFFFFFKSIKVSITALSVR